jgi:hypothetical protein
MSAVTVNYCSSVHPALVLYPSCIPVNVSIKSKRCNSKIIFPSEIRVYCNRMQKAKSIKLKM